MLNLPQLDLSGIDDDVIEPDVPMDTIEVQQSNLQAQQAQQDSFNTGSKIVTIG